MEMGLRWSGLQSEGIVAEMGRKRRKEAESFVISFRSFWDLEKIS